MIVHTQHKTNGLGPFSKLAFSHFIILALLSVYQHAYLYAKGITSSFFNQSFGLNLLNHFGFTALMALFLVVVYYRLEKKRFNFGKKTVTVIFVILFSIEFLLICYFLTTLNALGRDFSESLAVVRLGNLDFLQSLLVVVALTILFLYISKRVQFFNNLSNKLYPFTIVLFVLALGNVFITKKPINQNKIQYLFVDVMAALFEDNSYNDAVAYPLLHSTAEDSAGLSPYFESSDTPPNIYVFMIDGLGRDFVGQHARYRYFAPFLNQLAAESLFFTNHLSNAQDNAAALTSFIGALPFGQSGFTKLKNRINRNTLYGILKASGYQTAYYHGGNNTLLGMDKFLAEERVDIVVDKSNFGTNYKLSPADRAGNSMGYPDGALYDRWEESYLPSEKPKFEVFLNLSTYSKVTLPNEPMYLERVDKILDKNNLDPTSSRYVNGMPHFFASMCYADEKLEKFYRRIKNSKEHKNSIFIITGTQNKVSLQNGNPLQDYAVPLLISSPLLKQKAHFNLLSSHFDVPLSLTQLLHNNFGLATATRQAWLGGGLLDKKAKEIPLFRRANRITDFICDHTYYDSGLVYRISNGLFLEKITDRTIKHKVSKRFARFRSINAYVTKNNKVLPDSLAIYPFNSKPFTEVEAVWIASVFNGNDFDNAFKKALQLAHNGNTEKALLLCNHILNQVPNHIDALVLKGRLFAWNKQYAKAMEILEKAIVKNRTYQDAYSAYLDVCFWSGDFAKAVPLATKMRDNRLESVELIEKLQRCLVTPNLNFTGSLAELKLEDE